MRWVEESLHDRYQRVVLIGEESAWRDVTSSLVQGSVLGPVCFTMYINDLDIGVQSEISKFADDTKVICPIRNDRDQQRIQQDLDMLVTWARKWQMKFNVGKCSVMHFGYNNPKHRYRMDGKELKESNEGKDLGVHVNTSMKFNRQCAESAKKANEVMGMVKRNFINFDREIVINLYKSLIRPHLDYCVQVWKPYLKKEIALLEGVQRRMTRLIPGMKHKSYEERLKALKLMTVEQRHMRQDLITFYNITRGRVHMEIDDLVVFIAESKARSFKEDQTTKSSVGSQEELLLQ